MARPRKPPRWAPRRSQPPKVPLPALAGAAALQRCRNLFRILRSAARCPPSEPTGLGRLLGSVRPSRRLPPRRSAKLRGSEALRARLQRCRMGPVGYWPLATALQSRWRRRPRWKPSWQKPRARLSSRGASASQPSPRGGDLRGERLPWGIQRGKVEAAIGSPWPKPGHLRAVRTRSGRDTGD